MSTEKVGIEFMNVFAGNAYVDVYELAVHRRLDMRRFANLLMSEKTVALPNEDPVTYAVNAAKPIVECLSQKERNKIELLITCSESGVDFAKSLSTYVHHYLELNRNCRLFEIKQACYAGTAGLQTAINFILSGTSPEARALVIATDISRAAVPKGVDVGSQDWAYAEPSSGAGAVAMLVSGNPAVFQIDVGAHGYYGHEVMDTCRPAPDTEIGDADLSLMSYLDCCEQSFKAYVDRVNDASYADTFQYLAFHTPFGGMVRGAHRTMMRKILQASPEKIDEDYERRVLPGQLYCRRVGNIMSGTVLLSLASTIDNGMYSVGKRIGCFSYGSGCCSEFYSGIATSESQKLQRHFAIDRHLSQRHRLSMIEYEDILHANVSMKFGTRNLAIDEVSPESVRSLTSQGRRLVLSNIRDFHREYEWKS